MRRLLAALAATALACRATPPSQVPCANDGQCPSGFHCAEGRCVAGEQGPAITFLAPDDAAIVRAVIDVAVDAVDPDGVSEVKLVAGNAAPFAILEAAPFSGQLNTVALPDGPLTLKAQATDARGLTTATTRTVSVDNTAPVISEPALSKTTARWHETVTVTFTVSEPGTIALTVADRPATLKTSSGNDYVFDYRIEGDETAAQPLVAEVTVKATAADAAGNTSSQSKTLTIDLTCAPLTGDCDEDRTTGCERTLGTDTNCASCNDACTVHQGAGICQCQDTNCGCAVAHCNDGWGACGAALACDTPLGTIQNCRSCGDNCADLPNTETSRCDDLMRKCVVVACVGTTGRLYPEWGDCTDEPGCDTPLNTPQNCGACGAVCQFQRRTAHCSLSSSPACKLDPCFADWGDCEGDAECETPLDTESDCGACGKECAPPQNAISAACENAERCVFVCADGFHVCGQEGMAFYGCAADDDAQHCGFGVNCRECPDRGGGMGICVNGSECGIACPEGQHLCAPGTTNPNPIDPNAQCLPNDSTESCGTSCAPCQPPAGATATCDGVSCGFQCADGACEVNGQCVVTDLTSDPNHCGACETACLQGQWCNDSRCRFIGEPVLVGERTFGGASRDEYGTGVAVHNNAVFFSGWRADDNTIAGRYNLPFGSAPVWSHLWPLLTTGDRDHFYGMASGGGAVVVVGDSYSLTSDSVGGKEAKSAVLRFRLDAVSPGSEQYQPLWYSWWSNLGGATGFEVFKGATVLVEGNGTPASFGHHVYAVGRAQSSSGYRDVLVKIRDCNCAAPAEGAASNENRSPSLWTQFLTTNGDTEAKAVTQLNANIYAVGGDRDDGQLRPIIARYNTAGVQAWVKRGSTTFPVRAIYTAATAHGGEIYAAGYTLDTANRPLFFRVDKWDEAGNLRATLTYDVGADGAGPDELRSIAGIGNYVYAVGSAATGGAGGGDGVIVRVSTSTSDFTAKGTTYWGGTQYDAASAAATDGRDLFVVGETKSAGAGGSDVAILHYRVTPTFALGAPWERGSAGYAFLRTDTGLFNGTDCHPNSLPDPATYNSVPFRTGPKASGLIGIRSQETYLASPGGPTPIDAVYSVAGGGRYNAEQHVVWFRYADGSTAACSVNVPQDSNKVNTTGQCATSTNIGTLAGGPCSGNGLQMQTFTNPSPSKTVAGFTYSWTDQSNGQYPGRVYALTVKVPDGVWSKW